MNRLGILFPEIGMHAAGMLLAGAVRTPITSRAVRPRER
jgi:hypothetical protein